MHTCIHAYIHTCTRTYTCVHIIYTYVHTHIMCFCTQRHTSMPYVKSRGVSQVFSLRGGGQCFVGSCSLGFMFCLSTDPEHCGIGRCRLLCGFWVFESPKRAAVHPKQRRVMVFMYWIPLVTCLSHAKPRKHPTGSLTWNSLHIKLYWQHVTSPVTSVRGNCRTSIGPDAAEESLS